MIKTDSTYDCGTLHWRRACEVVNQVVAQVGWVGCLGLVSAVLLTWLADVVVMLRLLLGAPMPWARLVLPRPGAERDDERRHDTASQRAGASL